jgi:hypothetical protein
VLAILEMSLTLAALFRWYELSLQPRFELEYIPSFTLRPKNDLSVYITRHGSIWKRVDNYMIPCLHQRDCRDFFLPSLELLGSFTQRGWSGPNSRMVSGMQRILQLILVIAYRIFGKWRFNPTKCNILLRRQQLWACKIIIHCREKKSRYPSSTC